MRGLQHRRADAVQKIAQQVLGARLAQRLQCCNGQRIGVYRLHGVQPRQIIEQFARLGEMLRAARQGSAVRGKFFFQQRQQAVTQEVARITVVGIALVLDPAQTVCGGVVEYFLAQTVQ